MALDVRSCILLVVILGLQYAVFASPSVEYTEGRSTPQVTDSQLAACDAAIIKHRELYNSGMHDREYLASLLNCTTCMCVEASPALTVPVSNSSAPDGFGPWTMEYLPVLKCQGCSNRRTLKDINVARLKQEPPLEPIPEIGSRDRNYNPHLITA